MTEIQVFYLVLGVSLLITLGVFIDIGKKVYSDIKLRKEAKKRYESDPNYGGEVTDFYVPTLTWGYIIKSLLFFSLPVINVLVFFGLIVTRLVDYVYSIRNKSVIEW